MSFEILTNVSLQALNTMSVPAHAAYFCEITSLDDVKQAVNFAREKEIPIFVLGEGSNTIFKEHFSGLVLHNQMLGIELIKDVDKHVLVKVAAGENWHRFVAYAVQRDWFGLENLALIPGQIGAAPIQNIGAYGVEIEGVIDTVEFLDFDSLSVSAMTPNECQFAYRDSIFKHALHGCGVILTVTLKLSRTPSVNISYPALRDRFSETKQPTPGEVFAAVCEIRRRKLPDPATIPNSGSFFKNPIVDEATYLQLNAKYPDLVFFKVRGGVKLAAAWLIDQAGWKTKSIDQVTVHDQQALVIINPEQQSGTAVLSLAFAIQTDIEQKFGVKLELEPNII